MGSRDRPACLGAMPRFVRACADLEERVSFGDSRSAAPVRVSAACGCMWVCVRLCMWPVCPCRGSACLRMWSSIIICGCVRACSSSVCVHVYIDTARRTHSSSALHGTAAIPLQAALATAVARPATMWSRGNIGLAGTRIRRHAQAHGRRPGRGGRRAPPHLRLRAHSMVQVCRMHSLSSFRGHLSNANITVCLRCIPG